MVFIISGLNGIYRTNIFDITSFLFLNEITLKIHIIFYSSPPLLVSIIGYCKFQNLTMNGLSS